MMRRLSTAFLLSLCLAVPSFAEQDPNVKRGIAPGNTYRNFDIDTINEFNGNLMLRIPLAETPVGPFLNQGLMLAYNSKVYDYQFVEHQNTPDDPVIYKRRAIPEDFSNAGFGWTMSPGRLVPPRAGTLVTPNRYWFYRAPDGAEHDFTGSVVDDPAELQTFDGSFLRFRRYPSNTTQPVTHREIEFGDGTVHRFNTNGLLTQIRDRVGHTIDIDYADPMKWVITNRYNNVTFRTTTVHFENRMAPAGYSYAPNFQKVVHSIDVPAFGGGTATYELVYEDWVLPRDGCGDTIDGDPVNIAAPLLTEVRLPEGLKYVLGYQTTMGQTCTTGLVKSVKLPTLGSIEWTHQEYRLSQEECDDEHGWVVRSPGIYKRILKDAGGIEVGEWTYETAIDLNPGAYVACGGFDGINLPYGPAPTKVTTTITSSEKIGGVLTPVGGKTEHYFSAMMHGSARATAFGYKAEEYGLPLTRDTPHWSNGNRFLSVKRFNASNALVGSTYRTYAGDTVVDKTLSNARVRGELSVNEGDTGCGSPPCQVDVDHPEADYDGYGHYRKTVTTSNFGPTRTTFTNFTPQTTPWILGIYDSSWVEESNVASKELFTFDGNGAMRTRRTLVGSGVTAASITTDAHRDLLQVSCRDTRGFLTSERFFGGDASTALIPTGDPCTATPAATEYQIDHVFTFNGSGAPTKHTAKYPGTTFFIADEDLDVSTGFVSTSRDVSGIPTVYTYDGLGRPKDVKPAGAPWTMYEYSTPSPTVAPSLRVTTRPAGTTSSATPLTDAYAYYDWMGRSVQEKKKLPSDLGVKWSTTTSVYDLFSRPTKVSVPELRDSSSYESGFSPAKFTTTTYDVFGRPLSIVTPDAKTASISYTGNGVREIKKTAEVALASGASNVTTEETYDAYGRLTQVKEPTGTITRHSYDLAGRLTKVCQNTTNGGATCGQARTFTYDNRGFLTFETHPENSEVGYSYDSRGHALTKTISGDSSSERNLKFIYDAAERLTDIQTHHPTQGSYRPGKVFVFGTANTGTGGANKQLGKLASATRYNYSANEFTVKEIYDYDDAAGRVTGTTTEIRKDGVLLQKLTQTQAYDSGGNLGTINYPTCLTVSCGAAAWNTSTSTFTNGFLTGVTGFADSISYAASGTVSKVDHAGPVTDTYTPDDTGVRPKSIQFQGQTTCAEPTITANTPPDQSITPGATADLTVLATGASGFQWYEGNGTRIDGQTGSTYTTPPVTGVKTYYVEAYNDCKTVRSRTVTVNACPQLSITAGPQDQSIAPEHTATLSVSANGATSFQWYEGNGTIISGQTSSSFTTPSLTSTSTYYVKAINSCGSVQSQTATVTVRSLPHPTGLAATALGATSVFISWDASADADHYVVDRRSNGSGYLEVLHVNGTSATNSGLTANRSYTYRVRAVSTNELVTSTPSNVDLATTIVFTPLVAGVTEVEASHMEELLSAVNAVRSVNGTGPTTWSAILPAGVPAPAVSGDVLAQHILSLRTAMNSARTALGFPALSYTDPTLTDVEIRVIHQTEIRGGVE
jgi:YD repeat-containing protein